MTFDLTPTLFLAWLSHPEDGGSFVADEYAPGGGWRKHGPLHLSLHLRRASAEAALREAAQKEWARAELSYAWGPWEATPDPLTVMTRHIGYDAHVTEQPVDLP